MANNISFGGGNGGGGSSTLSGLSDVTLSAPTNGQVLKYDGSKWVNGAGGGSSGHTYSTTEQEIGTWVDGSTIYEKTYNTNLVLTNGTWVVVDSTQTNIQLISALTICGDVLESQISVMADATYGLRVQIQINKNRTMTNIVICYTKSST